VKKPECPARKTRDEWPSELESSEPPYSKWLFL
jgi:hypothetical protein